MMSTANKNQSKPSTSRGDLMTRGLSFISEMKYKKRKMAPIKSNSNDVSSVKSSESSSNPTDRSRDEDIVPLGERIAPTCGKDLIVHPKKIKEVADWIDSVFDDRNLASRSLFLVITGPSGSGKTTTIKLLAKDRNVEIIEYKDAMYTKDVLIEDLDEENGEVNNRVYRDHIDNLSQARNFKHFLNESNFFFNKKSRRRLIIVKEMPQTLRSNPESYHEIWVNYKKKFQKTGSPIVLIFTSDHPDDRHLNQLFPGQIRDLGPIQTIRFNPLTKIQTAKFLSKKLQDSNLNQAAIQDILQGDRCDLRSITNSVELKFESVTAKDRSSGRPTKRRRTLPKPKGSESGLITDRDQTIEAHHFVAKILYAKRDFDKMLKVRLPPHLKAFERKTLVQDPCLLIEKSPMDSRRLMFYLFENYTYFCQDIHHAALSMDWLSIADSLNAGTLESASSLEEYQSIIAAAGLMFSLCPDKPTQARCKGRLELRYHHSDRIFSNKKESIRKELNSAIHPKRSNDLISDESDGDISNRFHSPRDLMLDILPYLSVMRADSHPELRRKYDKRILSHAKFGGSGSSFREPFTPRSRVEHPIESRSNKDVELVNVSDDEDFGRFIDSDPDDDL